jgi:hypothetical protein
LCLAKGEEMKLYLFTRNPHKTWSDYVGVIIAADNRSKAKKIMNGLVCEVALEEDWKCILISDTVKPVVKEGIVLDSLSM